MIAIALLAQVPVHAQPSTVQPGVVERERTDAPKPRSPSEVSIPSMESPSAFQDAQSTKFVLKRVTIEGNNAIADDVLMGPFNDLVGKEVTIGQVFAATEAITRIYDAAGYALSLAYVPVQDVENGALLIRVIEGFIGDVRINDTRSTRSARWDEYAAKLKASRPLKSADLERYLLLISDLAGVKATNTFERMTDGEPGAMRLVMTIERKYIGAQLGLNNRGSKAIGPLRESANVDFNGVLGIEERLSIFGVTAIEDNELAYYGGRLDVPLGSEGTVMSFEAARSQTQPGTAALSALAYEAVGWTGSAAISLAVIRSLRQNLYGSVGLLHKNLKSDILALDNSHDRLTALALTADYDARARWGGTTRVVASLFVGLDMLDATQEGDPLSSRAGASGEFTRLEVSASHLMSLSDRFSLFTEIAGQVASGPLLVSEQCGYGGGYIGRAFDPFEVTGDHCVKGRAELRFDVPLEYQGLSSVLDNVQLYALGDFGVMIKAGDLLPLEERVETAESIGIGIRFKARRFLSGFVEAVQPLDRGVALENGSRDPRIFFGLSADY
ncbi:MAG: POTRA domain-containing protein [Alphaproteobacteria bacterium]|nr:POTRA domain-containing protein [Alphaproteobacteria bacterium]